MRIVVYADFLSTDHHAVTQAFLKDLVIETARQRTGDSFVLITQKPVADSLGFPGNLTIHPVQHLAGKYPALQALNKFLVKRVLKKLGADLFITASKYYVHYNTIPCVFLLLEPFNKSPGSVTIPPSEKAASRWIRANKQLYAAVKSAATTIVFSQEDNRLLQNEFGVPTNKIAVIPMDCVKETVTLEWEEKEHIKNSYTSGAEYFIFAGDIHQRFDLLGLLKAFSLFKKWQQSGMKLMIAGSKTSFTAEFIQKLATFKHRKDVHVIADPSTELLRKLIAAAYAFVYPATDDHFPLTILSAMRSGVPVITFQNPVTKEMAGNAVIYALPGAEGLSSSMQAVYKDEALRSKVIESAILHISQNHQNDILDAFYGILANTLHSKS